MESDLKALIPNEIKGLNLGSYVPYLIHRVHRGLLQHFESMLEPKGVTLSEWRVLASLSHHGDMRFGDLALATGLEPPTLVRVLASMEKRKWVKRRDSAADRRATDVGVTGNGHKIAADIIPLARQVEATALQGLTEDEAEFLTRLLRRLQLNVTSLAG